MKLDGKVWNLHFGQQQTVEHWKEGFWGKHISRLEVTHLSEKVNNYHRSVRKLTTRIPEKPSYINELFVNEKLWENLKVFGCQ